MKKSIGFLLIPLIAGLIALVQGQDAETTYPGGPALNRAPDFSSWSVTCQLTPANGSAPLPGEEGLQPFTTMTITKTKDVRRVESTDLKGNKTTRWYYGSLESYTPPGTDFPRYFSSADRRFPGAYIDFSQTDFPECDWIKPQMYTGTETIGGHKCLIFVETRKLTTPELMALAVSQAQTEGKKINPSDYDVNCRADVDLDTRLPVKNQVGNLTYTYQFLAPPTSPLPLPPLMQARIKFEQQRTTDLNKRPAAD